MFLLLFSDHEKSSFFQVSGQLRCAWVMLHDFANILNLGKYLRLIGSQIRILTPQKFNIDTKNGAMFKAGVTLKKKHNFGYLYSGSTTITLLYEKINA